MVGFQLKVLGVQALLQKLKPSTVKEPVNEGVRKLALYINRQWKQATPVGKPADRGSGGRLRSSITTQASGFTAKIGTNVEYAQYVEYGHRQEPGRFVPVLKKRLVEDWVPPSHVTPGSSIRRRDIGPATFAMQKVQGKIKDFLGEIGKAIEVKFG